MYAMDTYILTLLKPRSTQHFGSLMDKRRFVVEGKYTRKKLTSRTLVSPHTKVSIWLRWSYFRRFRRISCRYVFTYLHISGPTSSVRGNSVHLDNLCVLYNAFFFSLDNVDDQINSLFFRIVINWTLIHTCKFMFLYGTLLCFISMMSLSNDMTQALIIVSSNMFALFWVVVSISSFRELHVLFFIIK